jgi:hypothetical protein
MQLHTIYLLLQAHPLAPSHTLIPYIGISLLKKSLSRIVYNRVEDLDPHYFELGRPIWKPRDK